MEINPFEKLHHKILVSKSQGGDASEYEAELNSSLDIALKDKCPLAIDFINKLEISKSKKKSQGNNMTEANMTEANMTEANMTEANMTEANTTEINSKPSFLDKHSKSIIKVCETPSKILNWFMILSFVVMVGVEVLYV